MQVNSRYNTQLLYQQAKHTHTNHFTALLDFVRDYPGEQAPER